MKVYIHTDMEGASGIGRAEMIDRDADTFPEASRLLMGDVNAAVDGAFAGGATEVTVLDGHRGFTLDLLDPRSHNDTRPNDKWWGILDESYAGTFFIGAHAMSGTMNGFLDHTQSARDWYNYSVNGRRMGELAQWAMVAGHFGVPMLMVSGDMAACVEAREFFHPLETAVVKQGVGRNRADLVDVEQAQQGIREAARRSIELVGRAKPFVPLTPMEIVLEHTRADHCDETAKIDYVERLDARTVRWVTNNPLNFFHWPQPEAEL